MLFAIQIFTFNIIRKCNFRLCECHQAIHYISRCCNDLLTNIASSAREWMAAWGCNSEGSDSSPGEAFMPTPGGSAHRADRMAGARALVARARHLCRPPGKARTMLTGWQVQHAKKKPVTAYELFLKYGGEGGIDSLRSPYGQPARRLAVCPTGDASCRTPVGASHPPWWGATCEKKARTCVRALLKIWR